MRSTVQNSKFININIIVTTEAAAKRESQIQAKKEADEARKQAAEQKRQAQLQAKQQSQKKQDAEKSVAKASRGVTISLFGFGGDKSDATVSTKSTASTAAPRGVPVISKWKQARDGSITGAISGSSTFSDGDPITTSPIRGKAVGGSVVTTKSGSKYFLEGGVPPKAVSNTKPASNAADAAAAARANADQAKAAAAEAKRQAQIQAKQEAAAKREAQIQAKKEADETRKQAAEEKRRAAAEGK